ARRKVVHAPGRISKDQQSDSFILGASGPLSSKPLPTRSTHRIKPQQKSSHLRADLKSLLTSKNREERCMSHSHSTLRAEFSVSKAKLIISYVCLVGMPLLALLGILRAGQSLYAPPSLGGSWYLEADLGNLANGPCRDLLGRVTQPFMTICQSGAN